MTRLAKVGVLAALLLLTAAGPAEAFGRRQSTCCQPVYYYDCCCTHYPPQPVHHAGWDCVCNKTDKVLRVHITSGYGHFETVLHPGACAGFWFVKDGKPRVLSAFTLDNVLTDLVTFPPIDHTANPKSPCFPVIKSVPATVGKEQERQRVEGDIPHALTPTGQPF